MDRTIVHKLNIENKKVVGLQVGNSNRLRKSQQSEKIEVDGDVILCGGAFETPKVLQMSGIGDAEVNFELSFRQLLSSDFESGKGRPCS